MDGTSVDGLWIICLWMDGGWYVCGLSVDGNLICLWMVYFNNNNNNKY